MRIKTGIKVWGDILVKAVGKKLALLLAIVGASVVGGITTAVVIAAIPDSTGLIHGCYRTGGVLPNGSLRVINTPSQSCNANETTLNWKDGFQSNTSGGNTAFAHLSEASNNIRSLDTARTSNVNSYQSFEGANGGGACLTVGFNPKNVVATGRLGDALGTAVKTAGQNASTGGWSSLAAQEQCGENGNVFVDTVGDGDVFVLING